MNLLSIIMFLLYDSAALAASEVNKLYFIKQTKGTSCDHYSRLSTVIPLEKVTTTHFSQENDPLESHGNSKYLSHFSYHRCTDKGRG